MTETGRQIAARLEPVQTNVNEQLTAYFNENAITVEPSFPEIDRERNAHTLPVIKGGSCRIDLPRNFPEDRVQQLKREVFDSLIALITDILAESSDNSTLYCPIYDYEYYLDSEVLDVTFHAGFVENVERVLC